MTDCFPFPRVLRVLISPPSPISLAYPRIRPWKHFFELHLGKIVVGLIHQTAGNVGIHILPLFSSRHTKFLTMILERHKIIIPRKSFLNAQNCVTKNNVFKVCSKLTKPLMHHTSLPLWRRNAKEEIPGSPRIYTFGGPPSLSSPGRREHKFEDTPGVKGDRKGEKKSRRNFFREIMEFQRKTVFALSFFRISREVFQASTIPVWKGTFQGQTCLLTLGIEATSSSYSSFSFPGHKSNSPSFSLSSVFLGLVT